MLNLSNIPVDVSSSSGGQSAEVQFSPSGNFVAYSSNASPTFVYRAGEAQFTRIPGSPVFKSIAWAHDETYVVTLLDTGTISLRPFDAITGEIGAATSSIARTVSGSIVRLAPGIFGFIGASTFTIFSVSGSVITELSTVNTGTIRCWAWYENKFYSLVGTTLTRRDVSPTGVVTIVDSIANAGTGTALSISQDGTKFHIGANTAANNRIGFTTPLSIVAHDWTPYTNQFFSNSLWMKGSEYLQLNLGTIPYTTWLKLSSDLTTIEIANDVTSDVLGSPIPSNAKGRSAFDDVYAMAGGQNNARPTIFTSRPVPLAADLVAASPMADATFDTRGADTADLSAFAPMASATLRTEVPQSFLIARMPAARAIVQAHPPMPGEIVARAPAHRARIDQLEISAEVVARMRPPVALVQQRNRRRVIFFAVNE